MDILHSILTITTSAVQFRSRRAKWLRKCIEFQVNVLEKKICWNWTEKYASNDGWLRVGESSLCKPKFTHVIDGDMCHYTKGD